MKSIDVKFPDKAHGTKHFLSALPRMMSSHRNSRSPRILCLLGTERLYPRTCGLTGQTQKITLCRIKILPEGHIFGVSGLGSTIYILPPVIVLGLDSISNSVHRSPLTGVSDSVPALRSSPTHCQLNRAGCMI